MSVAVSCSLADGVVLGVDSAVTLTDPRGQVIKVFENADKLFQLGRRPIGIATFGLAGMEARGIGSYLREFEVKYAAQLATVGPIREIVELLRSFYLEIYDRTVMPELAKQYGVPVDQVPIEKIHSAGAILGLVVGGFSEGEYLSELWEITIPDHRAAYSSAVRKSQGEYGANWFAMFGPIRRYIKGFDPDMVVELFDYFEKLQGRKFSPQERDGLVGIAKKYEYPIMFDAMPIEEGVRYVRFLVELVVSHHRFSVGAPVVGGRIKIGRVTYKGEQFQILDH